MYPYHTFRGERARSYAKKLVYTFFWRGLYIVLKNNYLNSKTKKYKTIIVSIVIFLNIGKEIVIL